MSGIDTTIIILTLNGGDSFPRLLERIYSQQYSGSYEVIVIDSGSADGTPGAARKYPVRLVEITPEEFHHGRTRNMGAELAQGQYLVYITQDAMPVSNDWLQKLTDNFAEPQVAMVIGRQIPHEDTSLPDKFYYFYDFPDLRLVVKSGGTAYYHDNNFISNVNSALRKEIWQEHRFSETIVMAEDKELAGRLLLNGWTIIYDPEPAVLHSHNFSIPEVFDRALDYGLALKQGVADHIRSKIPRIKRTWEYMNALLSFLNDNGRILWLPYLVFYDFVLYVALFLGIRGIMKGPMARRLKGS